MKGNNCILNIYGNGYPDMLIGSFFFSWMVEGESDKQKAYHIILSSNDGTIIWNSGHVISSKSACVIYTGPELQSNSVYRAQVKVFSESGRIFKSKPLEFQTGLMDISHEWNAAWLTSPYVKAGSQIFRKQFSTKYNIRRARLFVCGLGYFELFINGSKVGNRFLDPAWTSYEKRINYVVYDVKEQLYIGDNTIGISLGYGWYANEFGNPRPITSLQLILEYENGLVECVSTQADGTWLCLKETWIVKNSIYVGEIIDARNYINGWASPHFNFNKGTWKPANIGDPPHGILSPMAVEPIRCISKINPISIKEQIPGLWIVDFGQNLAGIINLKLHNLSEGTEVRIRYAEILDSNGLLNTQNLRTAQACDIYISGEEKEEAYQSCFTYHGFRYIEITGLPYELKKDDVIAFVLRSDVKIRSSFETSNPLINQIQKICFWTESNNLYSIPTDCPQRDERLGWLNDLTVRLEEAVFNFDLHLFLRKFFMDIKDCQGISGAITDTVPYRRLGFCPADPVSSSYLLLPWMLWKHYGDSEVLEYSWSGIKAWTDYLINCRNEAGIIEYSYYGDWAAPISENTFGSAGYSSVSANTPGGLMSTGFLYLNAKILTEIAQELNFHEEEQYYQKIADETKDALNNTYLNTEKGYYATNNQASNVFMLYLNIVPKAYKDSVLKNLINNIREHNTHTTTGNICTRYIYDVLAENGYIDLAYELINQTTYPSWGYMLECGATTTWERWEYVDSGDLVGMASHNHPMYATISGWFYKYLAGIKPEKDGFEYFTVKPFIPKALGRITANVKTVKGTITIDINNSANHIKAIVHVPFNSTCSYIITDTNISDITIDGLSTDAAILINSGTHTIEYNKELYSLKENQ